MNLIDSVRAWLGTCPQLADERLGVDFLPVEAASYSVETVPCKEIVKQYLDGSAVKQFLFVVASRFTRTDNIVQNTENITFYEDFSAWVRDCNRRKALPALGGGRTARRVEVETSGYLYYADESDTARYQIQMKLTYYEKGSRT